jgi:predicted oxidoreductase (fatty acid repression mutant protein)
MEIYDAMQERRSIYNLGKNKIISEGRVQEIVSFALTHVPSAFNSQSARVLLLFGEESSKFWSLTKDVLEKIVPADAFEKTREKLDGFDSGFGTLLFFEDQNVVNKLAKDFSLYAEHFPLWSLQSSGMLQYAIWTSLASEGIGASLQHYNPLVNEAVRKTWQILVL